MRKIIAAGLLISMCMQVHAQTADEIVKQVRAKLDKVNDYEASGKMKTNVVFIKAPVANVKVYYKRPDRIRIVNEKGVSFIPKGAVNISLGNILSNPDGFDIIDAGKDAATGLRMIKLVPKADSSSVVLSTIYIDEKQMLIKKSKTTTRENGTYEMEMKYGKYSEYGLPDKITFTFNTNSFKLPKGVTLDYDNGSDKNKEEIKKKKGVVEISYSSYNINKGVDDRVFKN